MAEVKVIKSTKLTESRRQLPQKAKKRVAAYCRVSTDEAEQLASYASQIRYYTDMINNRADWRMVEVYADESITGTLAYKRDQFLRMIQDCRDGKIDMVITKSISRFARNVVDVIKYVRILKKLEISVYFEEERIDTLSMDGEMMLAVLGAVCQQEAGNISANVVKGLRMKMSRGELVGYSACLGYDYDEEKNNLVINEEEANLVKYIFKRYLDGAGANAICKELVNLGARTKKDNFNWTPAAVMGILSNEKYVGDLVQGKSYVVNPLTKRRMINHGEKDMYLVTDNHPSIISREDFAKAKEIRQSRAKYKKKPAVPGKVSPSGRKYAFSHMLTCGYCGSVLIRHQCNVGTKWHKITWICSHKIYDGSKSCPSSKGLADAAIKDAFMASFNKLKGEPTQEMIEKFLDIAREVLTQNTDDNDDDCVMMKKKLADINDKLKQILDMKIDGLIDEDTYKRKYDSLQVTKSRCVKFLAEREGAADNKANIEKRIKKFREIIESNPDMTIFNREIFDNMIDKVIVGTTDENGVHPYNIKFIYANGVEDYVDVSDKHGAVQGKHAEKAAINKDKDESPFDGKQEMADRQKGLLKNLLNQGVLNNATYNASIEKINQAIESAKCVMG